MLNETRAYELIKESNARICDGKLIVSKEISEDILAELRENKSDLIAYLSGDCFKAQVSFMNSPVEWVVAKVSNWGDVMYPPKEIFCGTAYEVDTWCREHKDDPLFTDEYTSKYTVYHR